MSKDDMFTGLPDELMDLIDDVDKSFSKVEIKVERRKYGKLWAVVSGVDADTAKLKEIVKIIKNKLAVAGTVKGKNIEVLFGRTEKTKDLIDILVSQGFNRDSIHVSSVK